MKAAFYSANGSPDVFEYGEVPDPPVTDDTVLIRVHYVGIQGGDVRARNSVAPARPRHVVGYQASGVVQEVGAAVTSVAPGDPVVGFAYAGSHAELFAVREAHAYPVPAGMDLALAAGIPIEFGTASTALFDLGRFTAGETVLIRGAAGGVGLAAVQLAAAAGGRAIAVAAGTARTERLKQLGAAEVIDYTTTSELERVRELTGGGGVDLVLDMVGGDHLLRACRHRGRYGLVGAASGVRTSFTSSDLSPKSLTIFGTLFGAEMHLPSVRVQIARFLEQAARGEVAMPIDRVYPLSAAAEAHRHIETGHPLGRVLLRVDAWASRPGG